MSNIPDNLKYSKDHEWLNVEGDVATIGITDYAQEALGDVVFVELPNEGDEFEASDPFGSVESVKAVSELFTPVSGEIVGINEELNDTPEAVNNESYTNGWMIRIKISDSSELDSLLSAAEYNEFLESESE